MDADTDVVAQHVAARVRIVSPHRWHDPVVDKLFHGIRQESIGCWVSPDFRYHKVSTVLLKNKAKHSGSITGGSTVGPLISRRCMAYKNNDKCYQAIPMVAVAVRISRQPMYAARWSAHDRQA